MRILCFTAVMCGLFACTRTVYVPQVQTRSEYAGRAERDSAAAFDSIFVLQRERNDTVYLYVDKFRYVYRDRYIRDTAFVRDSVPYEVIVEEFREVRHVPKFFRWCLAVSLAAAGYAVWRIVRRVRGLLNVV